MRLLSLVMMLFLLTSLSCEEERHACIDESKINPNAMCIMIYVPVCGCDGKTYGNTCAAENSGVTRWEQGACQ
jgi:hypothetical protein